MLITHCVVYALTQVTSQVRRAAEIGSGLRVDLQPTLQRDEQIQLVTLLSVHEEGEEEDADRRSAAMGHEAALVDCECRKNSEDGRMCTRLDGLQACCTSEPRCDAPPLVPPSSLSPSSSVGTILIQPEELPGEPPPPASRSSAQSPSPAAAALSSSQLRATAPSFTPGLRATAPIFTPGSSDTRRVHTGKHDAHDTARPTSEKSGPERTNKPKNAAARRPPSVHRPTDRPIPTDRRTRQQRMEGGGR